MRIMVGATRSLITGVTASVLLVTTAGCSTLANYEAQQDKNARTAQTHVQLGVGYLQQNKPEVALEKLKKAIEYDPDSAAAHSAIAMTYERLLKYEKADEHYREAIDLNPEDGGLYNNYGVFLCKQNRLDEAEEYFEKAINTPLYKTPELAYENAGACAMRIPDQQKAESYLTKALKKNPQLPVALINMAEIRFEQENYLSSRGFLQRFEAVSSHNAASLWLAIRIERKLGNDNAVATYSKQLQTQFPKSEQFKLMLNSLGESQS